MYKKYFTKSLVLLIMFQFDQDHLRITKPISINGLSPKIVDGKVSSRIIHLPLNAEKGLKEQNTRLPDGLKMKIEKIPGYKPDPVEIINNNHEVEMLKAEIERLKSLQPAKKMGRPKKIVNENT